MAANFCPICFVEIDRRNAWCSACVATHLQYTVSEEWIRYQARPNDRVVQDFYRALEQIDWSKAALKFHLKVARPVFLTGFSESLNVVINTWLLLSRNGDNRFLARLYVFLVTLRRNSEADDELKLHFFEHLFNTSLREKLDYAWSDLLGDVKLCAQNIPRFEENYFSPAQASQRTWLNAAILSYQDQIVQTRKLADKLRSTAQTLRVSSASILKRDFGFCVSCAVDIEIVSLLSHCDACVAGMNSETIDFRIAEVLRNAYFQGEMGNRHTASFCSESSIATPGSVELLVSSLSPKCFTVLKTNAVLLVTAFEEICAKDDKLASQMLDLLFATRSQNPMSVQENSRYVKELIPLISDRPLTLEDFRNMEENLYSWQVDSNIFSDFPARKDFSQVMFQSEKDVLEYFAEINYFYAQFSIETSWVENAIDKSEYERVRKFAQAILEGRMLSANCFTVNIFLAILQDEGTDLRDFMLSFHKNQRSVYADESRGQQRVDILSNIIASSFAEIQVRRIMRPSDAALLRRNTQVYASTAPSPRAFVFDNGSGSAPRNVYYGYVARSWKNRWRRDYR